MMKLPKVKTYVLRGIVVTAKNKAHAAKKLQKQLRRVHPAALNWAV